MYVQPFMWDEEQDEWRRVECPEDNDEYKLMHGVDFGQSSDEHPEGTWEQPGGESGSQQGTSEFRFNVTVTAECPGTAALNFTVTPDTGPDVTGSLQFTCDCLPGA